MTHIKSHLRMMGNKGRMKNASRPRLSGKVAALAVGRGKCEQKHKRVFIKRY